MKILHNISLGEASYTAAAVTIINIPIHVYWALGGKFLLPGGSRLLSQDSVRLANLTVSIILAAGALAIWLLPKIRKTEWPLHGQLRVLFETIVFFIGVGAIVCIPHAVFGFLSKSLYAAGLDTVNFPEGLSASEKWHATLADLLVFEPWFLLEGMALALVGWVAQPTPPRRKYWLLIIGTLTTLIFLLGVALTLMHKKLAIS